MKNKFLRITGLSLIFILILSAFNSDQKYFASAGGRTRSFDQSWKFTRDSIQGCEDPSFDDSKWRVIDLPHDWSIEDVPQQVPGKTVGPFSKESPGGPSTGHVLGGTGWYRKKFVVDKNDANKEISVYFEGVYMNADVWLNGHFLGNHPYGYTSFSYDLTPLCKPGGQANVIAVRVSNLGKNSRWYSGSGIYRHVWLIVTDAMHVDQWGVYITTPEVKKSAAAVKINTTVQNENNSDKNVKLKVRVLDRQNKQILSSTSSDQTIKANDRSEFVQSLFIDKPILWSIENPYLYTAEILVFENGKLKDSIAKKFGIRKISVSPEKGLLINDQKVLLKGGCVHHDYGVLGSAAIDRAEERKVELLKSFGFNAVRCSHNPPSETFLNVCDRLGMMVIDEAFDQWQRPKNPDDYNKYFDQWWEKDLTAMVKRDRNHPSVIFWSIGNEINERADSPGLVIARKLISKVKSLDNTRPITEAICEFWDHPGKKWAETAPAFELLDVGGYNYQWWNYEPDHQQFPQRIMMGTESVPQHAYENWRLVEKNSYVIGDFVWTAMDYLGESGIGHTSCANEKAAFAKDWPWFNSYCGDIDLCGFKKPQSYFRDVVWNRSKLEMAIHAPLPEDCKETVSYWGWPDEQQSWTWPGNEGKTFDVNVYSSCPVVQLFLNGKLIAEKSIPDSSKLTAKFQVPYQPGELKAVGILNGQVIATRSLSTIGKPARINLSADRNTIRVNRNDLSFITVSVVDEKGKLDPNAEIPVQFIVNGSGEIAGVGSGDPADMSSFRQSMKKTFRGKCLVVLRPKGKPGIIELKASAKGLIPGEIKIKTN